MYRAGINDPEDVFLWMGDSLFPMEIDVALDFRHEDIYKLNDLTKRVEKLSNHDRVKLGAVVSLARPERADQICRLIDNLALFELRPAFLLTADSSRILVQKVWRS